MTSGSGYGPAVVDGRQQYVSVTQVNLFSSCETRWYFKYVERLPDDPPSRGMLFGISGHERIEKYLKTGVDHLGPLERLALVDGLIPTPGPDLIVEGKVEDRAPLVGNGVPFKGGMDLLNPRFLPEGFVELTDWKFKSDIDAYGTTPEKLIDVNDEDGRQVLAYAEWARRNRRLFPGMQGIRIRHVHFNTGGITTRMEPKGPLKVRPVSTKILSLDEIEDSWHVLSNTVLRKMGGAARAKNPRETKGNTGVCHKYHKACPYLSKCPWGGMNPLKRLFPKKSEGAEDMSLLKNLQQLSTTPAPAPVPPPIPAGKPDVKAEAPVPESAPVGKPVVQGPVIDESTVPDAELKAQRAEADAALVAASEAVLRDTVTTPPADPPKKRGRPRKDATAAAPVQAEATVTITASGENLAKATGTAEQLHAAIQTLTDLGGIRLYFGCAPIGVATETLHAYARKIEKEILETTGQINATTIMHAKGEDFAFGKWEGSLARYAAENPPPAGHYVVTGGDKRIEVIAAALEGIVAPGAVVRGGR